MGKGVFMSGKKTAIVTGAQQGIGAGLVEGFLAKGYNVVATSLKASQSLTASPGLVLVDGDITKQETSAKTAEAAMKHFGNIDVLVNNAGIFYVKPFTEFTPEDFDALVSVNLLGFIYMTQLAVKQMLKQKSGSVVTITGALADNPIAGVDASVSMITKGGLNTITRSLAIEYAKEGIRFNAVAPGVVDTPLHEKDPKEHLRTLQPMGKIANIKDIVDAVLYLADAEQVTGEVLHVDGGAHSGRW
jgi:NAD(P)-dependent dehydrogenase (short-subunit alcohol dehydrogenase family)